MTDRLFVLMGDQVAGTLTRESPRLGGPAVLTFGYDPAYRNRPRATPLSLSMPLRRQTHGNAVVTPWLWGLLPDNTEVLQRWARTFHVSGGSPFALLSTPVGEDCAGAVRLVGEDRVPEALASSDRVEQLDGAAMAARLGGLRADPTSWLGDDATSRFSLAGAQAKTALLHRDGRWGVPRGSVPTSHILKPAISGFDDHDVNEHMCLTAARACGMPVATSTLVTFAAERVIAVDRYDRTAGAEGVVRRIHQEDCCQALGHHPQQKYQSDGGPGPARIADLLRQHLPCAAAQQEVGRFTDALIFNWLIGGTDAHAKNYGLLLSGPQVRLAPLYDIGSALPYPGLHVRKLRLAMKFGGDYSLLARGPKLWAALAAEVGLPEDDVRNRARRLIERTPDAFADASSDPNVKELGSDLPTRLVDAVAERVAHCALAV